MTRTQTLAAASIGIGLLVLAIKTLAWWLTGSVALLSDAIESIVNVATAVAAFLAVRFGARPADADHPYGHHKAEYFSAVIEGVLIILAALAIARAAWGDLVAPREPDFSAAGLAVNAVAAIINGGWAAVLIRHGRTERSPALIADGQHLVTDVVSSVLILAGLMLATLTGWPWLDPALALLVAVSILFAGMRLVRASIGGLMDEALPPATLTRIRELIAVNSPGALEAHDLRTRYAGRMTFIDFHLVVPGTMSVSEAHDICDSVERAIKAEVADALISVHVEPENKAKHAGIVVL